MHLVASMRHGMQDTEAAAHLLRLLQWNGGCSAARHTGSVEPIS